MVNVYYGTSGPALDSFMYGRIAGCMPKDTILLVPDQYTLQAERDAFRYMNADALLDLEIISRAGFAGRVLEYAGRPAGIPVNKYGRYMLLSVLTSGLQDEGGIFSGVSKERTFLEMLTDLITEMKQFGIGPGEISEIEELLDDDGLLREKLAGIREIYSEYQKRIELKYSDSEDLQHYVSARAGEYPGTSSSVFWIYGFDYMAPGMLELVQSIASAAPEVNIVLSAGDDENGYEVTDCMLRALRKMADDSGSGYSEECIFDREERAEPEIRVVRAGDIYSEAESIAVIISELVRDKGFRYNDIVVLCNDLVKRGSILKRVFDSYDIPVFIDDKRGISHEPEIEFILSMIDCVSKGRRADDVFRMLKTGFSPLTDDECDLLENYCRRYHIRSGRWKTEFRYGEGSEGAEDLAHINECRAAADSFLSEAERLFKNRRTVREKAESLYLYLTETVHMPERISAARSLLEKKSRLEQAGSSAQMWNVIIGILDQVVEVLGDEEMSDADLMELLRRGFEEVRIGLIPTTGDQVLIGNMLRSRFSEVKALFIAGANDGVLPDTGRAGSLFSEDERQLIEERYRSIGRTDRLRQMEQDLAIARNISKTGELLVISYASQDTEGSELRPSILVSDILEKHPDISEEPDIISVGDPLRLVQRKAAVMQHFTKSMRDAVNGIEPDDVWKASYLVLCGEPEMDMISKGLFYTGKAERADRNRVRELFGRSGGEITLSASSLEKYSRCPFSFFIAYGLRPREDRTFEVDMRSVGDIYHACLRHISRELTEKGVPVDSPGSRWMSVSDEELSEMVSDFIDRFADEYREGVLHFTEKEEYIRERIKKAAAQTVMTMVMQVRSGRVKRIFFEQRFGREQNAVFPPVIMETDDGERICIEGIIDRVDIIGGGSDGDYIRIVDYKTGSEKFDLDEVRSGWRMQLMIYLRGAMGGIRGSRPAGVFYFSISEGDTDITEQSEDAEISGNDAAKRSRLDGILVNDPEVIDGMDRDFSGSSAVLPVYRKIDGTLSDTKALLSEDEFYDIINVNDLNMKRAAEDLSKGCVDIAPAKGSRSDACKYCSYRGVCNIID